MPAHRGHHPDTANREYRELVAELRMGFRTEEFEVEKYADDVLVAAAREVSKGRLSTRGFFARAFEYLVKSR